MVSYFDIYHGAEVSTSMNTMVHVPNKHDSAMVLVMICLTIIEDFHPSSFTERVPKPVIKLKKIKGDPDVVYLICEYSESIIWRNSSGEILIGSLHHPKGEFITVEFTGNPDHFYTCTLDNGASTETSDPVYERDLFQGKTVIYLNIIY